MFGKSPCISIILHYLLKELPIEVIYSNSLEILHLIECSGDCSLNQVFLAGSYALAFVCLLCLMCFPDYMFLCISGPSSLSFQYAVFELQVAWI